MAMAVVTAFLLVLWCSSSAFAFQAEVKPNNYPNFEFHESAEVKPQEFATSQFSHEEEVKPNNYPNFEFHESAEVKPQGFATSQFSEEEESAHGQFAQLQHHEKRSGAYGETRNEYVYDAHQESHGETHESFYSMGVPVYRGSDASNRHASSYDLINAKEVPEDKGRFGDAKMAGKRESAVSELGVSGVFYTPATDTDFVFRFAKPESTEEAKPATFSQFSVDETTTHGTTASAQLAKANSVGHGCANMYWAEHTKEWPSFFSVHTQVAQAFGLKAGDIYGTTTLLQALYDNRSDGYSQLLSHGTAALMNAYAMPNYGIRHDAVIDQFLSALSSRTAAGVQAQKFFNANHAYGPNECLN